jgi:hypothetical protein
VEGLMSILHTCSHFTDLFRLLCLINPVAVIYEKLLAKGNDSQEVHHRREGRETE